jgi:drug/metabolite transporter (DMT)-like permease
VVIVIAFILVIGSGLMHAVWNLFTKTSTNKIVFLWSIHITSFVLLLPQFVSELWQAQLTPAVLALMLLSMAFQMAYCFLLPIVYRLGDMSQTYPIMRGTGALLVPILSVLFMGETMTPVGWAGVCGIVLGLFALGGFTRKQEKEAPAIRNMLPVFAVGLCITGYVMTDKIVLQTLSPVALIELANIAYLLVLSPIALRSGLIKQEWKLNFKTILLGTVCSPGSYLLFLFAMQLAPLSYLAPMREIGTVFGALFGIILLKESDGLRRIILSGVITAGVISVGIWGSP